VPNTPPSLNYTNNDPFCPINGKVDPEIFGSYDECGGLLTYLWSFTDDCDRTISYSQDIIINPAPIASFIDPPEDYSIPCTESVPTANSLFYSNGENGLCEISGAAIPSQSISLDDCGGEIRNTWRFTDICDRTIIHIQTITVEPASEAVFLDFPEDLIVDCADVLNVPQDLDYSNGENGLCNISGSIPATQSGSYDACGGFLQNTWIFTDDCGRQIDYAQLIQILPAPDPIFIDPPEDITLDCGEDYPNNPLLEYDNFIDGTCEIHGFVEADILQFDENTYLYSYFYTNPCTGETIDHLQFISISTVPDINVEPPVINICAGESFDLTRLNITDNANSNPIITYHSDTPANSSNELPSPIVSPGSNATYYILATNSDGCTDETFVSIVVDPGLFAGDDGTISVCPDNALVNLFDHLGGNPDFSGGWFDFGNTGINITNPGSVNFGSTDPGIYPFHYIVFSGNSCPNDTAIVSVEVFEEPIINVEEIACIDLDFYSVLITGTGFDLTVSHGMIDTIAIDTFSIFNIPIDVALTISIVDQITLCTNSLTLGPPNCSCPNIPAPISGGDLQICEGEPINPLSVTVGADETANWYDSPNGGTLLLGNSLSFTPSDASPGIYSYYAESQSTLTPECVSTFRTELSVEIISLPLGNDALLSNCDDNNDGFQSFDLTLANAQINTDPSLIFSYYENMMDAENGINPIGPDYINTNAGSQSVFVVIENAFACKTIVQLDLLVLESPLPEVTIFNETCLGSEDGNVSINSTGGTGQIMYSLDNMSFTVDNFFLDLAAGNYVLYVIDENNCGNPLDFEIQEGFEFTQVNLTANCQDNNTSTDPSDDFYTIEFNLSNNQGGAGTFNLTDGNQSYGPFEFDMDHEITMSADGQTLSLTFTDESGLCSIQQDIGPLNSCSTSCEITITQLDYICDDNDTPSDPSDDFYSVTLSASAMNGASNDMYDVSINGVVQYSFLYDIVESFTLPANGAMVAIGLIDNEDLQCQTSELIGPLIPCSTSCEIAISLFDYVCDDNETASDPSDDFYIINLVSTGVNTASSDSFDLQLNGIYYNSYRYNENIVFILSADSSVVNIELIDQDDLNCTTSHTIGPLISCSTSCDLSLNLFESNCSDAGTTSDPSDDTYEFIVNVEAINGSSSNTYSVFIDGTIFTSGTYGEDLNFTLNADSTVHIIALQDDEDIQCVITQSVGPLNPCSFPCEIGITYLEYTCDNNGTA
ncbi:MAG: hypothetical protein HKN67_14640, partial [Saprospiraceae bacterium]|nr:hypothetical protein [Saprospiraceae bacterium]